MKTLKIPRVEGTDKMSLEADVMCELEQRGTHCPIDNLHRATDYSYKPLTRVNIGHSGSDLYIDFFVRCNYLSATNYHNNTDVLNDSSVAFLLSLDEKGKEYIEIDLNCIGTIKARRVNEKGEEEYLTDDEIGRIERYASSGTTPFREVEGLFAWNVTVKIPFDILQIKAPDLPVRRKGNIYKCALSTTQPHFLTWNRIGAETRDFDPRDYMGTIIFED